MGEWTPGPWQRIGWKPIAIYGVGDLDSAERICKMDDRQEHDANARLISAAPDLVEALEDCCAAMKADNPADGWREIIERAEAALAKARSE